MKKFLFAMVGAVLLAGLVVGCGGAKVDENKTPEQIATEVKSMSQEDIKEMIDALKVAIQEKEAEAKKLAEQIKEIPLTDLLSEKSVQLKDEAAKIADSLKKLAKQVEAYTEGLTTK